MTSKFALLPTPAIFDKRLTGTHLRCLAVISYYGGHKDNGCWPSYGKMAYEIGTTRNTMIKNIAFLIKLGYISKQIKNRENGSRSSNIYKLELLIETEVGDKEGVVSPTILPSIAHDTPPSIAHDTPIKNNNNNELNKGNKRKKASLVTLEEWEKNIGAQLNVEMLKGWCIDNKLSRAVMQRLIDEFRMAVMSREKQYADFRRAFQNYFLKGWLSKTPEQAQMLSKQEGAATTVESRGVNL